MKYLSYLLILIGIGIIVFARVDGIDMTEGRLLINYLPYWIAAVGCLIGGVAILNNIKE